MRKIDKQEYKEDVIRILKNVGKPIWVSDLSTKHGLPYSGLHSKRNSPASQALKELIKDKEVVLYTPKEYKVEARKCRRKIGLPTNDNLARHARSYFELALIDKIKELQDQIDELDKSKGPKITWWMKIFN